MAEVDRLLRDGLWRASQRNDATLKLCWLMRTVWGLDPERTESELWCWMRNYHNGQSKEFMADPEKVRGKIRAVVLSYDPEKAQSPRRALECPRTGDPSRSALGMAIEAFVDAQPLDTRERAFLARLLEYAHRRGEPTLDGQLEVEIPSRTLKTFDREYPPVLRLLVSQGIVEMARNYSRMGRCKAYRLPLLEACSARPVPDSS